MTRDELEHLLKQKEGQKLDFKSKFYDINNPEKTTSSREWDELIKDILSLANGNISTAKESGYLIIGASDKLNKEGSRDLTHITELGIDEIRLLSKVNSACNPPFEDINIFNFNIDGKNIYVFKIPSSPNFYATSRRLQTKNRNYQENTFFIRRGSEIGTATLDEINKIQEAKSQITKRSKVQFRIPFGRDANFIGREAEIKEIHHSFSASSSIKDRFVVLSGMGGIGKTQLAIEYAYQYKSYFPDGIFWIDVTNGIVDGLIELGRYLNILNDEGRSDASRLKSAGLVLEYFLPFSEALLIFDNLGDAKEIDIPIAGQHISHLSCKVLITSRRHSIPFGDVKDIPPLDDDSAVEFLLKAKSENINDDVIEIAAAKKICRSLGNLPLALALAYAYLKKYQYINFSSYLERLKWEGDIRTLDGSDIDTKILPTRHEKALYQTIETQLDVLEHQGAMELLKILAIMPKQLGIPRARLKMFYGKDENPHPGYHSVFDEFLSELMELSLIGEPSKNLISIHPLIHEFIYNNKKDELESLALKCATNITDNLWLPSSINNEISERGVYEVINDLRSAMKIIDLTDFFLPSLSMLDQPDYREKLLILWRLLNLEAFNLFDWKPNAQPGYFLQQLRNRAYELGINKLVILYDSYLSAKGWPYFSQINRVGTESPSLIFTNRAVGLTPIAMELTADGNSITIIDQSGVYVILDIETGEEKLVRYLSDPPYLAGVFISDDIILTDEFVDNNVNSLRIVDVTDPENCIRFDGHCTGNIYKIVLTKDNHTAITCSSDKTVSLWDVVERQKLVDITGFEASVSSLTVDSQADRIFIGFDNGEIKIYDRMTGYLQAELTGHSDRIIGLSVIDQKNFLISTSTEGLIIVWNLADYREVNRITTNGIHIYENLVSREQQKMYFVMPFHIKTTNIKNILNSSEIDGTELIDLLSHEIKIIRVTKDGKRFITAYEDGTVKVWDLDADVEFEPRNHYLSTSSVTISKNGLWGISASDDQRVGLWQSGVEDDRYQDEFNPYKFHTLGEHESSVTHVILSDNNEIALSAGCDGIIKIFDIQARLEIGSLIGHGNMLDDLIISRDGRWAASVDQDHLLFFWDINKQMAINKIANDEYIHKLGFVRDESAVIASSVKNILKIWEFKTGKLLDTINLNLSKNEHCNDLFLLSDNSKVLFEIFSISIGEKDRTKNLLLLDIETQSQKYYKLCHSGILSLAKNNREAISGCWSNRLTLWNWVTGEDILKVGGFTEINCCDISPDGKILMAGDKAGGVYFWERIFGS